MEASDAFAPTEIAPEDDPFAGTDFGDFSAEPAGPPVEPVEPVEPLPIVDREGAPVPTGTAGGQGHGGVGRTAEKLAALAAESAPEAAQEAASAPPAPAPSHSSPEAAARDAALYRERTGEPAPAEALPITPAAETAHVGDRDPSDDEAAREMDQREAASDAEQAGRDDERLPVTAPDDEPPDADPPEEPVNSGGKTTGRKYVILRVDGPGKFSQVSWYVDHDGNMVPKGPNTKRQSVALSKAGPATALGIGYRACGSPPAGITLIAVAALHFQPKSVKPKPMAPERQRLQIG
jgi:hypothetical protein